MQKTLVRALDREVPTCHGATKPATKAYKVNITSKEQETGFQVLELAESGIELRWWKKDRVLIGVDLRAIRPKKKDESPTWDAMRLRRRKTTHGCRNREAIPAPSLGPEEVL
ncbi:hypothetical protein J1605_001091 [Eschrichtius robustus]|uniref:Uncharacterized protein n=1 Tax=Eschrichtius robustus TaxID=9764 RepID=A0AB34GP75_ESCRO|nr:hypothetical protein J1605_001091 [Eschrichtius robustus]